MPETRPTRLSRILVVSLLGLPAVTIHPGCAAPDSTDVEETRSALTSADVLGFETSGAWSTTTAGAVLSLSSTHSQGASSLAVKPANGNGYTPIVSVPLSTLSVVSPTIAWDVMLPTQQPNPSWFGTAQTYLNCPSRGIYSAFLGQVELTGKPLGVWNTVAFSLTNDQVSRLLTAGYADLTVTVVVNVPVPTTGVYRVDNLRMLPVPSNGCAGRPNGTFCNDGNLCTQTDRCQAGICAGADPKVCAALDSCHKAGTCAPATGTCSNPMAANGTHCDDGNSCTFTDSCHAGVCAGTHLASCPAQRHPDEAACTPQTNPNEKFPPPPPAASLGGPVLIGTQIKVVFWNFPTAFTSAQNQRLVDFYSALVSVNPYYDWVTFQYTHDPNHDGYFHYGSAAGYPITPASPSWTGYLAFNQNDWTHTPQNIFEAELAYQIQQGTLPAPGVDASTGDPNTLFMIHLPPQIGFSLNQGGVACADTFGYHSSFTATINGAATTIIYGVIPDFTTTSTFFGYNCNNLVPGLNLLPFDNMTVTASHEVFEAITNPVIDQPAWFNEIGDGCNQACLKLNAFDDLTTATGAVDSTTGSPYKVQLLWAPNVQECAGVFPAWWD